MNHRSYSDSFFALVLLISILAGPTPGFAGTKDGAGGHAIACYDNDQKLASVKLLDLVEAEKVWNLELPDTGDADVTEIVQQALNQMSYRPQYHASNGRNYWLPKGTDTFYFLMDEVVSALRPLDDFKLTPIHDHNSPIQPQAPCYLYSLGNYLNSETILVQRGLFNKMSPLHKASFLLHEMFYRWDRSWGATDSKRARRIVGHLMAKPSVFAEPPHPKGVNPRDNKETYCSTDDFDTVFLPRLENGKWTLYFISVLGELKLSKTVVYTDSSTLFDFDSDEKFFRTFETTSDFEGKDTVSIHKRQVQKGSEKKKLFISVTSGWNPNLKNTNMLPITCRKR